MNDAANQTPAPSREELDKLVAYILWLRSGKQATEQKEGGANSVIAMVWGAK